MAAMQTSLIQKLMAFEAVTLAVASSVHLIGGSYDAGVAEGLICIALLIGLVRGQKAAFGALCFAVFGFVVGLTTTVRGGDTIGLVYHATMLPMLVWTVLLVMPRKRRRDPPPTARTSEATSQ